MEERARAAEKVWRLQVVLGCWDWEEQVMERGGFGVRERSLGLGEVKGVKVRQLRLAMD